MTTFLYAALAFAITWALLAGVYLVVFRTALAADRGEGPQPGL